MTKKKKLIISISALCVAVIAVVGVVVGVLAAQTQTVANTFEVGYVATNVKATASASYTTKLVSTAVDFKNGDDTSITFTPSESSTTKTLTATKANLTSTDTYVLYKFYFKNDATTGGHDMTVTMANTESGTNVSIKYATDTEGALTATSVTGTTIPTAQTVEPQGEVYFYMLISIVDDTLDANFSSTGISWALASVA